MNRLQMVGFDARELWLDTSSQWNDTMRRRVLLRPDVVKPLSVDNYVWYSVFTEVTVPRIWKDKALQAMYYAEEWQSAFAESNRLQLPDLYRPRRVWTNLASLMNYLNQNWKQDWKPCAIIAVQEVVLADDAQDEEVQIEPQDASKDWTLLGYDVADYELYSGLSDGGITDALSTQIKADWIEHLNEFHLFSNPETAIDYIDFANARNPSHRPYHVYALYLVQTMRASLPT